jgi:hypothetical protein
MVFFRLEPEYFRNSVKNAFLRRIDDIGMAWDISMVTLEDERGIFYKVTRRVPELSIAETRVYRSKTSAMRRLKSWLREARRNDPGAWR